MTATNADLATGRTVESAIKSGERGRPLERLFRYRAFVSPAHSVTSAQLGRNIIRGPKQINTDLSIMKLIPVTESQRLEFRAEFFNLFNNVNFANPVNVAASCELRADGVNHHRAQSDPVCAEVQLSRGHL